MDGPTAVASGEAGHGSEAAAGDVELAAMGGKGLNASEGSTRASTAGREDCELGRTLPWDRTPTETLAAPAAAEDAWRPAGSPGEGTAEAPRAARPGGARLLKPRTSDPKGYRRSNTTFVASPRGSFPGFPIPQLEELTEARRRRCCCRSKRTIAIVSLTLLALIVGVVLLVLRLHKAPETPSASKPPVEQTRQPAAEEERPVALEAGMSKASEHEETSDEHPPELVPADPLPKGGEGKPPTGNQEESGSNALKAKSDKAALPGKRTNPNALKDARKSGTTPDPDPSQKAPQVLDRKGSRDAAVG